MSEVNDAKEPTTRECLDSMSVYYHHDSNHMTSAFSVINKMRLNNQLNDVTLRVGDTVTKAHRLVLASSSQYFYAMFNNDMAEKSKSEVEMKDVDFDALQLIVEFSYTGRVRITDEVVHELLSTSTLLQVNSVRDACTKFLTKRLSPNNCLCTWHMAETYSCDELKNRSYQYALKHFGEVAKTDDFLSLSISEIEDLVGNDNLFAENEEQVFSAIMDWIKHDTIDRSRFVAQLMRHVRMTHMSKRYLVDVVETEPLVKEDRSCFDQWLSAMKYHVLPEQRSTHDGNVSIKRRSNCLTPLVYVVGGSGGVTGECYNPKSDRWLSITPMTMARNNLGVASLGMLVYAVGGSNYDAALSSCERYDPNSNSWSAVTSMGKKRSELGVGVVHGLLYACGGFDGCSTLNSVERYDPVTGVWTSCPDMINARHGLCVSAVDDCLYAVGGYGSNAESTAERYDPRTDRWTLLPKMIKPRAYSAAATLDRAMYCVGGHDYPTSCERFDVRRHAWEPIANMINGRHGHALVALNGELMVLGGNDGNSRMSTERYDPSTDTWTVSTPMLSGRINFGAAVVRLMA